MPRVLYFDCFAGASGDMVLGALLDAGLPLSDLERAVGPLMLPGCRLEAERVMRAGLAATKFRLIEPGHDHQGHVHEHEHPHHHDHVHEHGNEHDHHHDDHAHEHEHTHHHAGHGKHAHPHEHHPGEVPAGPGSHTHRTVAQINELVGRCDLSPAVRERALELFNRLARAEAQIHQMPVERVHLHEVGELDSIIDIVGSVFGLDWFAASRFVASPLNVGGGMVKSAHGVFPVPAPATLKLLDGAPVYSSGVRMETVTPTGALLVAGYATSFGPLPAMRVERTGYGAGNRDLPGTPNVLRVIVGEEDFHGPAERVVVVECEIDDMNPQIFGVLMDRLYSAGALEVFYNAVQMKKNRPGTLLTVVARPEKREELSALVFRESTTIGLRYQEMARACLAREMVAVETQFGTVRFKVARLGSEVVNASPEFDDCARLAAERNVPVKQVQAEAIRAYWSAGR